MKIGDSITLTDEEKEVTEVLMERQRVAQVAFEVASSLVKDARKDLWDALFSMYPEFKDYKCNYNHKKSQVLVTGAYTPFERSFALEDDSA